MEKGKLYVVSAPSGCGKGTILSEVLKHNKNVFYSVSATTRNPREGEIDGVNYYFYSHEKFQDLIKENGFFEYASFCGNFYGTPKAPVFEHLENGDDVILEIETNGAMQVKKAYPEAKLIFILPPSIEELSKRLHGRGTEPEEVIVSRIAEAEREIELSKYYDYRIVNDNLSEAIADFEDIINEK